MNFLTRIRTLRQIRPAPEPELPAVARSVAIVMDGNGRWAKRRGLPVAAGHRAGTRALRRTVEAAIDLGVESLAVYAFSTENWTRPADEVGALMEIFGETIERELPDLCKQGVRVRFIGRRDGVPDDLRRRMTELETETAENTRLDLWVALNYGGRAEIADAARRVVAVRARPRRGACRTARVLRDGAAAQAARPRRLRRRRRAARRDAARRGGVDGRRIPRDAGAGLPALPRRLDACARDGRGE